MKRLLLYLVSAVAVLSLAPGCSQYNKLLKSEDNELLYRAAFDYYEAGKYNKAITLFERVRLPFMGTNRSDSIEFFRGMSYYKQGDFELSGMVFDDFRKQYLRSAFTEEAEYLYAMGYYYMSPPPYRDQSATRQAIMAIDEYVSRYPNSVKRDAMEGNIDELMDKLDDKEYLNAKLYYNIGKYKSAVVALKNAIEMYPDTKHREEVVYLIAKSGYELASNSVVSLKRERFIDMRDYYLNYISEFPDGEYRKELDKMDAEARNYLATFGDGTETIETQSE